MSIIKRTRRNLTEKLYKIFSLISRQRGVTRRKRSIELIVSLTSIPERIETLHICIESLLRQDLKPDRILLWLSDEPRADKIKLSKSALPSSLTSKLARGLEIRWCKDLGPFRKLLPTLRQFPKAIIVTADDDVIYPRDWLQRLYQSYREEPTAVHCYIAHQIEFDFNGFALPYSEWKTPVSAGQKPSMALFPVGAGGVLYAPGHLNREALSEKEFLRLCPRADDIWWKAMSLINGTPVKKVEGRPIKLTAIKITQGPKLSRENVEKFGNDRQLQSVNKVYGCFDIDFVAPDGACSD